MLGWLMAMALLMAIELNLPDWVVSPSTMVPTSGQETARRH